MSGVQQIIAPNASKDKLLINEQALKALETIKEPVVPIAIVGPHRDGKSFLLSRALLSANAGFNVSNSVQAGTLGIWAWISDSTVSVNGQECRIVVLDTEGLRSTDKSENYDVKIFTLAILLSSVLIFNTKNVIDETSIDYFGLVVKISKHVIANTADKGKMPTYFNYFPNLIWVLRDFFLELDKYKTTQEYIENLLQQSEEMDEETNRRNMIRRMMVTCFKSVSCVALPRPATDEAILQNLNEQPDSVLRTQFVEAMGELKQKINSSLFTKTDGKGATLNGPGLAQMIRIFTEAMNSDKLIVIADAWETIKTQTRENAVKDAVQFYTSSMQQELKTPIPWPVFFELHAKALKAAQGHAIEKLVGFNKDIQACLDKIQAKVIQEGKDAPSGGEILPFYSKNSEDIFKHNSQLLRDLWQRMIVSRMDENASNRFTTMASLKEEGAKLLASYEAEAINGSESISVLAAFRPEFENYMERFKSLLSSMQDYDEKIVQAGKDNAENLQTLLQNEANMKKLQEKQLLMEESQEQKFKQIQETLEKEKREMQAAITQAEKESRIQLEQLRSMNFEREAAMMEKMMQMNKETMQTIIEMNKESQASATMSLVETTKAIASYRPPDPVVVQRPPAQDDGLIPTIGGVAGKIVDKVPCIVM